MPAVAEAPELSAEDVKKHIVRNSISNYVFLVVRVGLGAVLFRLIYQELSAEDFGFWSVLWSMLGYGILLDLGLGFTAQKRVAELCVHRDWDTLSRVLSTIFFTYLTLAMVLVIGGWLFTPMIVGVLKISPQNVERYTLILRLFLVGMGLALPLGVFPEILRGQHRISLVNNILLGCYVASFVGILFSISHDWGLASLFAISMGSALLADLICALFAMRQMPKVRISPSLFSKEMIRETTRFSVYAYIGTLTTVILTRTDQLIISTGLAVAAVAVYQAGAKVSELFSSFALQMADTLSPAAAHLHAKGDKHRLRNLLVKASRFTTLLATPLYLCCAYFLGPILHVLTGDNLAGTEAYWVGQVLLLWTYMMVVSQSVTRRVFMMSGRERRLTFIGLGEAGLNLALSIALMIAFKSVLSVAVGSFLATLIFGWLVMWPWAAREAGIGSWELARAVILPAWVACMPLIALIITIWLLPNRGFADTIGGLIVQGSLAGMMAVIGLWKFALDHDERAKVGEVFLRRFGKGSVA